MERNEIEKYRSDLKNMIYRVREAYKEVNGNCKFILYGEHIFDNRVWMSLADLIEKSDFGRKPAEVNLEYKILPGPYYTLGFDETPEEQFDEICSDLWRGTHFLNAFGKVVFEHGSNHPGTKIAIARFEPEEDIQNRKTMKGGDGT